MVSAGIGTWLRREEGQDLSEYALLLFLIVVTAVAAVTLLGDQVSQLMNDAAGALGAAVGP